MCSLPVQPSHFANKVVDFGQFDSISSPTTRSSPGSRTRSPRTTNYIVRNTFIEVQDHDEEFEIEEEMSRPTYDRRRDRGSSFWRSASEPPNAPRTPRDREFFDVVQEAVEVPVAYVPAPAVAHDFPRGPPGSFRSVEEESALAAAMHVGFNAGVMAAMSMKSADQHVFLPTHGVAQTPPGQTAPAPSRGRQQLNAVQLGMLGATPSRAVQKGVSSSASDTSTTVGSNGLAEQRASSPAQPAACHVVWCDHRAFKETSSGLKAQLEAEVQLPVKAHKSAENVIRLLRKKQRAQGRPPCVFVVSWANAGALLPFLNEFQQVSAKVVVLCDARGGRRQDGSEEMFNQYPFVEKVASNWTEAVHAAGKAVAEFQVAQW